MTDADDARSEPGEETSQEQQIMSESDCQAGATPAVGYTGDYFVRLADYAEGLNELIRRSPLPGDVAYYLYTGTIIE